MSTAWRTRAERLFPGGVNSPVRDYRAVGGDAAIVVRGEGSHVWDADGNSYVDYVGAFGPLILGHAYPAVVSAVREAAGEGGPFGATSPAEVRLGELIERAMPSIQRLRFVNSGTEAAMSALRVARAATGRDLLIKFDGGYHGHADSLLVKPGSGAATLSLPGSAGVTEAVASQTLVAPYNDLKAVERLLDERVAAVIVEPVAANVGVVPPAPGFLEGLRELCSRRGALLIFDEVITGFRVAPGGAQERYGVTPDLTVLGKIIGGGLPVGAYGGARELMDLVAPAGPVYQAGTLSGHPLVMAAGEATLSALDGALYRRLELLGAQLQEGLQHPEASVARVGSLLTVFFRDGADRFGRFFHAMKEAGILLPPSQFEAWFISAAHSDADVERTIAAAQVAYRA
jgi:glutamate-1-semialdehyde 2,1-aminomutase